MILTDFGAFGGFLITAGIGFGVIWVISGLFRGYFGVICLILRLILVTLGGLLGLFWGFFKVFRIILVVGVIFWGILGFIFGDTLGLFGLFWGILAYLSYSRVILGLVLVSLGVVWVILGSLWVVLGLRGLFWDLFCYRGFSGVILVTFEVF